MTHPYASEAYARACGGETRPLHLSGSDVWLLARAIPGSMYEDAMGAYPRCPLPETEALTEDFAVLAEQDIVSLVLVTDVFFHPSEMFLRQHFDRVTEYKHHYVHRYDGAAITYGKHHRYEIRRARRFCETRVFSLAEHLDDWCGMYATLVERHGITGVQAFSRGYFEALARLPGLTAIGAFVEDRLVSAHLWLEYRDRAYSHLAASSEEGYAIRAAYPIYDDALHHYAGRVDALDFGAGAGTSVASQGLSFFKKGFANTALPCYLCGKILRPDLYATLTPPSDDGQFFPAYRR